MNNKSLPLINSPIADIYLASLKPEGGRMTLMSLGGRPPETEWLRALVRMNAPDVWAVDSGVGACRAARLHPSVMIGDGDSATREDWEWAVEVGAREAIFDSAKNLTDFQLALEMWDGRGTLVLTGCFGGRFDHLLSVANTFSLSGRKRYEQANKKTIKSPRCMIDHAEGLFLIRSRESARLEFKKNLRAVSLLPMTDRCEGVSIQGVRWPLDSVVLKRNMQWAVSNELVCGESGEGGVVDVCCAEGVLAVYWCCSEGL